MNQVEKFLMQENREKKRAGSGAFSRVSTRKGGGNQPLRTPYYYMSRKEREGLNGDVISYNNADILPKQVFDEKAPEMQGALLLQWVDKYTLDDIAVGMGLSCYELDELKVHYGVKGKRGPNKNVSKMYGDVALNDDFFKTIDEQFKMSFDKFKTLNKISQTKLVVLLKGIHKSNSKICENVLGIKEIRYITNLLQHKDTIKENIQEPETKTIIQENTSLLKMPINQTFQVIDTEQKEIARLEKSLGENVQIAIQPKVVESPTTTKKNGFHLSFNGTYGKKQLKRKIEFLLDEIDDSTSLDFDFSMDISEK